MSLPSGCRYWHAHENVNAVLDASKQYRYLLECVWDADNKVVTFVMLNPSHADTNICDRTINRCVNYSKSWGYGKMNVVNLFALRSKDPKYLKVHPNPIGDENDRYILDAVNESDLLLLAWGGKHSSIKNRNKEVQSILSPYEPYCLKKTVKGNHPRHPLYLKKDLKPIPY
ncbi:DUF1643 domain-containing protein [Halobacillus dabanensis]|nr:DUF1643 domain-containing protein [Halobacillus dabanensis]